MIFIIVYWNHLLIYQNILQKIIYYSCKEEEYKNNPKCFNIINSVVSYNILITYIETIKIESTEIKSDKLLTSTEIKSNNIDNSSSTEIKIYNISSAEIKSNNLSSTEKKCIIYQALN